MRRFGFWEGDEQDGDVVVTAVVIGCFDERLAGCGEVGLGGGRGDLVQEHGNLVVGEFAGEAVGGEEIDISGLGAMALDLGFDLGERAYGAGDEVAHG